MLPWRFRVRLALDIASTLAMMHADSLPHQTKASLQQQLCWTCVCIDSVHWRAYIRTAHKGDALLSLKRPAMSVQQQEQEHVFQLGIVLCCLISGGADPSSFLVSDKLPTSINERALQEKVLHGCPAILEALALMCCSAHSSERPSAHHAADAAGLRALL